MVVQAAGARAQAETRDVDPSTLEKIERSGREALAEMRRLLGVMREERGPQDAALQPNPGLAELPALAERVRGAGVNVDLRVETSGNERERVTERHLESPHSIVRRTIRGARVEVRMQIQRADGQKLSCRSIQRCYCYRSRR